MMLKDEMWISDNEFIKGYPHAFPCVFDHKRDGAVSYTRTSLVAAKDAEIARLEKAQAALLEALERAKMQTNADLRKENDRLVRMLAECNTTIWLEGQKRENRVQKEIQRIREELRGGGV